MIMTEKEIDILAKSLTEEYLKYRKQVSIEKFIKRIIEIVNMYHQEKK